MHIYTCDQAKTQYDQLIESNKNTPKIKGKTESHHIIPRSHEGSNDSTNLVNLTYEDHLLAHYYLWKIYNDKKMSYAFFRMLKSKMKFDELLFDKFAEEYANVRKTVCGSMNGKKRIMLNGKSTFISEKDLPLDYYDNLEKYKIPQNVKFGKKRIMIDSKLIWIDKESDLPKDYYDNLEKYKIIYPTRKGKKQLMINGKLAFVNPDELPIDYYENLKQYQMPGSGLGKTPIMLDGKIKKVKSEDLPIDYYTNKEKYKVPSNTDGRKGIYVDGHVKYVKPENLPEDYLLNPEKYKIHGTTTGRRKITINGKTHMVKLENS